MLARVWALIAAESVSGLVLGPTEAYLHNLCVAAVRFTPASGAALSVMAADSSPGVVVASDRTSHLMAELQVTLGEGPVVDAYALRRPVLVSQLAIDALARWPSFTSAALDAGVQAVFAFPLQIGAARLGVLDLHRSEPGPLADEAIRQALTFAEVAVLTLLDGHSDLDGGSGPHGLEQAFSDQAELYQAQGMVKIQLGVSLGEAMARLRAHAYATDDSLANVAHHVVGRQLRLDRDA